MKGKRQPMKFCLKYLAYYQFHMWVVSLRIPYRVLTMVSTLVLF